MLCRLYRNQVMCVHQETTPVPPDFAIGYERGRPLPLYRGAASKIIDATDSDIWIVGRGASCFEFPVVLDRSFEQLAQHGSIAFEPYRTLEISDQRGN